MITLHSNFKDKQSTLLYSIPKESSAHDFNVKTLKTVKYMYC